jgi:hypothetical protein
MSIFRLHLQVSDCLRSSEEDENLRNGSHRIDRKLLFHLLNNFQIINGYLFHSVSLTILLNYLSLFCLPLTCVAFIHSFSKWRSGESHTVLSSRSSYVTSAAACESLKTKSLPVLKGFNCKIYTHNFRFNMFILSLIIFILLTAVFVLRYVL